MAKRKCVCTDCGGYQRDVGLISHTGLCADCGDLRMVEAGRQIAAREGPFYDAWLAGTVVAMQLRADARARRRQLEQLAPDSQPG